MSNKFTYLIAGIILILLFVAQAFAIRNDSLTMDELAHLPAGYSYLSQMDMRLNPEHPPLVKDLSAIPLLFFKDIKFTGDIKAWKSDVNGQWDFGNYFLFKSGNPAQRIIFWGRIPMILLLVVLCFYVFLWTKELFGNKAGLLALFLSALSPTFLAHGRIVTTDVGAALGVIMASYYYFRFLKDPSPKKIIISGVALGIALLLKFSLILLIPFFGIAMFLWVIFKSQGKNIWKNFVKYLFSTILIGLLGLAVIWLAYLFHVWNYPPHKQLSDTTLILQSAKNKSLANLIIWMSDKPILRAIAHYALGLLMIFQRASGGNTGYFMGEISAAGWKAYFPAVYLLKETITFHLFSLIALLFLIYRAVKSNWLKSPIKRFFSWVSYRITEISMVVFIAIYWATSLKSNLNIGVRHLLPVFPFTIILVSGITILWLGKESRYYKFKLGFVCLAIVFQFVSVALTYPHMLSYFNEAVGGSSQGYKYVADSNLDWGQELKRLKIWLDDNNINAVYLDYFGGSDTTYYLGNKYKEWHGHYTKSQISSGGYLAVSATYLDFGLGKASKGYTDKTGFYEWLNNYTPVTVIGNSIFVYRID